MRIIIVVMQLLIYCLFIYIHLFVCLRTRPERRYAIRIIQINNVGRRRRRNNGRRTSGADSAKYEKFGKRVHRRACQREIMASLRLP